MALTHTVVRKNAIVDNETAAVGTAGDLVFYTGSPPGAANAATGTLLGTIDLPNPAFPAAAAGAASLNGVPVTTTAVASGTAGYYRLLGTAAAVVHEGTVGTTGSDINFAAGVAFVMGGTISISSYTINGPA